jgi:hypothetical protein
VNYVAAGYLIVLGLLAAYAGWLAWRRRRLTALAARVEDAGDADRSATPPGGGGPG